MLRKLNTTMTLEDVSKTDSLGRRICVTVDGDKLAKERLVYGDVQGCNEGNDLRIMQK